MTSNDSQKGGFGKLHLGIQRHTVPFTRKRHPSRRTASEQTSYVPGRLCPHHYNLSPTEPVNDRSITVGAILQQPCRQPERPKMRSSTTLPLSLRPPRVRVRGRVKHNRHARPSHPPNPARPAHPAPPARHTASARGRSWWMKWVERV